MATSMRKIWSMLIALVGLIIPPVGNGASAASPRDLPPAATGEPAVRPPRPVGQPGVSKSARPLAGQTLRQARNSLLDMWVKDASFNRGMRKDPVGTLSSQGIKLTKEDSAAVKRINWKASDKEILDRASGPWDGGGGGGGTP